MPAVANSAPLDRDAIMVAIEATKGLLDRAAASLNALQSLLETDSSPVTFDPMDPANKHEVGGLLKLTPRGVEICYRLFDEGKSRYAVASLMNISFGAADHRFHAWEKAGGVNRERQPLE